MSKREMLTILSLITIMALVGTVSTTQASVYPDRPQSQPRVIDGRVTVRFEDDVDIRSLTKGFGKLAVGVPSVDQVFDDFGVVDGQKIYYWINDKPPVNSGIPDMTRWYEFQFDPDTPVQEVIEALNQNPNIRSAEPVWALPLRIDPNDAEWPDQWAMQTSADAPLFPDAWELEAGSDSIKFALIDSGINYLHPDLQQNIWVNPGEDLDNDGVIWDPDDMNGVDDDGNGFVDDLHGWDFFNDIGYVPWPGEDYHTPDNDPSDFNGHGTHVAGIAAAPTNNGFGVAGSSGGWYGGHRSMRGCRIICCRVGGSYEHPEYGYEEGFINSTSASQAIGYAVDNGVDVINSSWGGSSVLFNAYNYAIANEVTFTHAAGNDNNTQGDFLDSRAECLSVAATGPYSNAKASFSNYGPWIDISAPGVLIRSTYSDHGTNTYASLQGTSMSAPMVAGVALLIRSMMPSLTRHEADSVLLATADAAALYAANPSYPDLLGSGRVDAYAALAGLPHARFTADASDGNAPHEIQFTDLSPNSPSAWDWDFGNGDGSSDQNPLYTYTEPGLYDVSLKVDEGHPLGWGEEHLLRYVWVRDDYCTPATYVAADPGDDVVIPISLTNTARIHEIQYAFSYDSPVMLTYDSFSVAGTRCEDFQYAATIALNPSLNRAAVLLKRNTDGNSNYLEPGSGVIVNIWFSVNGFSPNGVCYIDTTTVSSRSSFMTSLLGQYWPEYEKGSLTVGECARGDVNFSGVIDISDLVDFVAYAFDDGPPVHPRGGDVDASGVIDISDIVYLVAYMFDDGPPPPE